MTKIISIQSKNLPNLDNIGAYKRYVYSLPILSVEEENNLAKEFKLTASLQAAQKLVFSQLKMVVKIAEKYGGYGLSEQDLIQEGNIGLMKAVKNFDPMRKIRLYSYAIVWVKAEIQAYVLQNWKMVKLASTKPMKKLFFNLRASQNKLTELGVRKGEMPKIIAKEIGVLEDEVREAQCYFNDEIVSLSETTDDGVVVYDTPSLDLIEDIFEKAHDSALMKKNLAYGWNQLLKREQEVLNKRFYSDEKITHKDLAKSMGVSGERVRQIEARALQKLKLYINSATNNAINAAANTVD